MGVLSSSSKNKLRLREQIEQRLARINDRVIRGAKLSQVRRTITRRAGVDVAKAAPGLQRRRAKRQCHVVNQERPVRDAQTVVPSNLMSNARLKQNVFKRFGAMKTQVVHVKDCL